jgi:LysR family transcriptional regulator of gallate degradation
MLPTHHGELLVERARRALAYLDDAQRELTSMRASAAAARSSRSLVGKIAQRHLHTLSALADHETETAAAQQLGISQPAVTLALRDLEAMVETQLFLRTPRGMVATGAGEVLIRGAKLALNEIGAAADDIATQLGEVRGQLVIGVLPLSGTLIAPLAVSRLARQYPALRLSLVEAHYGPLLKGLRCGDIDVIIGALHPDRPAGIEREQLYEDVLSVAVRQGHPLAARDRLTLDDLTGAEWVVPFRRTALRNTVERAMLAAGLTIPDDAIEANTVALVRGLLLGSDRLSVLSRGQIQHDRQKSLLTSLPVDLPGTKHPIGFAVRSDAVATPALQALRTHLRQIGGEQER